MCLRMEAPRNIVGPQVMRLRNTRGWSQEQMAAACQLKGWDVSRGVIARIEGGVRWVADFELLELAAILQVPVPDLYPADKRDAFHPPA
jgi:transcriptional regulator with XRE-family HTH domain